MQTSSESSTKRSAGRVRIDAWLRQLSLEQLQKECEKHGLAASGIVPTLQVRLQRYLDSVREFENPVRTVAESPATGHVGRVSTLPLDGDVSNGPVGARTRPEDEARVRDERTAASSPSRVAMGSRERKTGDAPRSQERRGGHILSDSSEETDAPPARVTPRNSSGVRRPRKRDTERLSAAEIYEIVKIWNVSFAGDDSANAQRFIEDVKRGWRIMPIAEEDLLAYLSFFLTGAARRWYDEYHPQCHSWAQFQTAFLERFGRGVLRRQLREEARGRQQGAQESASDYLSCVRQYYAQIHPPWSLIEQLDTAHLGLWPRLQRAVPRDSFESFEELERLVRRHEEALLMARRYRPVEPTGAILCPGLQYKPPARRERAIACVAEARDDDTPSDDEASDRITSPAYERVGRTSSRSDKRRATDGTPRDRSTSRSRPRRDERTLVKAKRSVRYAPSDSESSSDRDRARRRDDRKRSRERRERQRRDRSASRHRRDSPTRKESEENRETPAMAALIDRFERVLEKHLRPAERTSRVEGGARRAIEAAPRQHDESQGTRSRVPPRREIGPCYTCGEVGHGARTCPRAAYRPGRRASPPTGNATRRG